MRLLFSLFASIAQAMAASASSPRWLALNSAHRPDTWRDSAPGRRKRPNRLYISRRARRRHRRAA